jgi:hypothetical protein
LAYCVRSQRYLAHQITAPQIAGAKAIDPAKDCDLTSAIIKRVAHIKVKERKNSEAISQVSGMKKKPKTVNSLISPAPILIRKISGARIKTDKPVIGCVSLWVTTLSKSRDRKVIKSTRLEIR